MGLYWVQNFLEGHFKPEATAKYGYKFRKYWIRLASQRRELKTKGMGPFQLSRTPLVKTGYMKQELLSHVVVRGFPSRATVVMFGPKYTSMNFRTINQPNKPKEITTVTKAETRELIGVLKDALISGINAVRQTRVTT